MDKIYSRRRIRIPRIKSKKKNKISKILFFIMLVCIVSIGSFIFTAYPIFVASCKTAAGSKATHIVTEEVDKVMSQYSYDELMDIEKDDTGKIILMKSNVVLINKITSMIVNNIQTQIDNTPRTTVYINYGSVSGISMLKMFGPQFDIELETAGKINTQVKSEFESKRSKSNIT